MAKINEESDKINRVNEETMAMKEYNETLFKRFKNYKKLSDFLD